MEPAIDAQEGVHVDNDNLDCEVKAVEASAAVIPCWVASGPRREAGADAKAGAEEDQEGREEEDPNLGAKAPGAEFVDAAGGVGGTAHLGEDDADD